MQWFFFLIRILWGKEAENGVQNHLAIQYNFQCGKSSKANPNWHQIHFFFVFWYMYCIQSKCITCFSKQSATNTINWICGSKWQHMNIKCFDPSKSFIYHLTPTFTILFSFTSHYIIELWLLIGKYFIIGRRFKMVKCQVCVVWFFLCEWPQVFALSSKLLSHGSQVLPSVREKKTVTLWIKSRKKNRL